MRATRGEILRFGGHKPLKKLVLDALRMLRTKISTPEWHATVRAAAAMRSAQRQLSNRCGTTLNSGFSDAI
jgi:hypothetical protein